MPTRSRPPVRLVAGWLVTAQALVITGFGGYLAVAGLTGHPTSRAGAELAAALAVLGGLALLLVARGVLRGRGWSRSPALLAEILSLPVGWGLVQGGRTEIGLPLILVALVALVSVLVTVADQPAPEQPAPPETH